MTKLFESKSMGLRFKLGNGFKTLEKRNGLFLKLKKGYGTVAIDIGYSDEALRYLLSELRREPTENDILTAVLIENEPCATPLRGWLRITQILIHDTGKMNWGWIQAGYTSSGRAVQIHICGDGDYFEKDQFWNDLVNSLEID